MHVGPETSVALSLSANEIDSPAIGILSPGTFMSVKERNPNIKAWTEEAPYAWHDPLSACALVPDGKPPMDDPRGAQGHFSLIDRDQIVALAYEGATVVSDNVWPEYSASPTRTPSPM